MPNTSRQVKNGLETEMYHKHSGYPGGLKSINLRHLLEKNPEKVIKTAVWGMLPHNKWGRKLLGNLKVYGEAEHPHRDAESATGEVKEI